MTEPRDDAQDAEIAPIELDEPSESGESDESDALEGMRGTGVGVEDPNIVGDVGPTDVPPGRDPDGGLIVAAPEGEDPQAVV